MFRLPTSEVGRRPRLFEKRELARGICAGEPRIGAVVRRRYARLVSRNGFTGCLQGRAIQQMLAQRSPEKVTLGPYLSHSLRTPPGAGPQIGRASGRDRDGTTL